MSNLATIHNALEGSRSSSEAGELVYLGYNDIDNEVPSKQFCYGYESSMHVVGVLVTQDDIDNAPSPGVNAMADSIVLQAVQLLA